jgi:hypothetical protein
MIEVLSFMEILLAMMGHAHAFRSLGLYFWILGLHEVSSLDNDKAPSIL